jgi:hypothetical protein
MQYKKHSERRDGEKRERGEDKIGEGRRREGSMNTLFTLALSLNVSLL